MHNNSESINIFLEKNLFIRKLLKAPIIDNHGEKI
jgi:hypothetical protein